MILLRSPFLWLGILSLIFLLIARSDSWSMESGGTGGHLTVLSSRDRVIVFADTAWLTTPYRGLHTWRRPTGTWNGSMPPFRPEEIFHRTGYYRTTRQSSFLYSGSSYDTLSLPYSLVIAADLLLFTALGALHHYRRFWLRSRRKSTSPAEQA